MTTETDPLRLINATIYKQSDLDAAVLAERERCCRLLCQWCRNADYNKPIWHHEEWRHYRESDMHVEVCDASAIRGKSNVN